VRTSCLKWFRQSLIPCILDIQASGSNVAVIRNLCVYLQAADIICSTKFKCLKKTHNYPESYPAARISLCFKWT
jgi:hypothetical protein